MKMKFLSAVLLTAVAATTVAANAQHRGRNIP
jgi:hypothetical protein